MAKMKMAKMNRRRHLLFIYWLLQLNIITRTIWVHPLNEDCVLKGEFYTLYPDLRLYPKKFFSFYQMSVRKFDYLLQLCEPRLKKEITNLRQPISPEQCLVLTLR